MDDDTDTSSLAGTNTAASASDSTSSPAKLQANGGSKMNKGVIAGLTVAIGVLTTGIAVVAFIYLRMRRGKNNRHSSADEHLVEPYVQHPERSRDIRTVISSRYSIPQTLRPSESASNPFSRQMVSVGDGVNQTLSTGSSRFS